MFRPDYMGHIPTAKENRQVLSVPKHKLIFKISRLAQVFVYTGLWGVKVESHRQVDQFSEIFYTM